MVTGSGRGVPRSPREGVASPAGWAVRLLPASGVPAQIERESVPGGPVVGPPPQCGLPILPARGRVTLGPHRGLIRNSRQSEPS